MAQKIVFDKILNSQKEIVIYRRNSSLFIYAFLIALNTMLFAFFYHIKTFKPKNKKEK